MSRLILPGASEGISPGDIDEILGPLNIAGEYNVAGTAQIEQTLSISGVVFDETQAPVPNATVALMLQSGNSDVVYTQTDAIGEYEFTNHPDSGNETKMYHVAVYDDVAPINNAFSKPFVPALLNTLAGDAQIQSGFSANANVIDATAVFQNAAQFGGNRAINKPVAYDNMVAWYPFDSDFYGGVNTSDATALVSGSADSTAYDGTTNQLTYRSTDGVTDINDGANSGAFEGNNSTGLDIPVLPLATQWTMTAWGYFFNNNNEIQHLVMVDASGWNDDVFVGYNADGNSISSGMAAVHQDSNNQVRTVADSGIDPVNNTWYHLAATSDGNTLRFYLDGVEEASANKAGNDLNWGSERHIIGGHRFTTRGLEGYVDDVRFYNTALTQSQINDIYLNTQP